MKHPNKSPTPAFAAFVITVVLALTASAMTLWLRQTAQVADSQVHTQIDQLLPADLID